MVDFNEPFLTTSFSRLRHYTSISSVSEKAHYQLLEGIRPPRVSTMSAYRSRLTNSPGNGQSSCSRGEKCGCSLEVGPQQRTTMYKDILAAHAAAT